MTDAYAIKDKDDFIDARYIRKWERECWKAMVGNHEEREFQKRITHLKQHLFSCVPVTVSEKGEADDVLRGIRLKVASLHDKMLSDEYRTALRNEVLERIDAYLSRKEQ